MPGSITLPTRGREARGGPRPRLWGPLHARGSDLKRSAIFVGGSDVAAAEEVMKAVQETFFGPFRVSVLFDANGSNTTAAAAVLAAIEGAGGSVEGIKAAVLAGTGPVGQRVARLLAGLGAEVAIGSRSIDRARATADAIGKVVEAPSPPSRHRANPSWSRDSTGPRSSSRPVPRAFRSSRNRPASPYRP